jgi:voltage-gated sodium channel
MSNLLVIADKVFLGIFTIELVLKIFVYKGKFAKDPWRVFDFVVVSIALLPKTPASSTAACDQGEIA